MNIKDFPSIEKELKKLKTIEKEHRKILDEFDSLVIKNGCNGCNIFKNEKLEPFDRRFLKCNNCKYESCMKDSVKKIIEINKEYDDCYRNTLPKMIYNELKDINPKIKSIRTKEYISFIDTFGSSFDDVPKKLYASLVGLITEDGGLYRF